MVRTDGIIEALRTTFRGLIIGLSHDHKSSHLPNVSIRRARHGRSTVSMGDTIPNLDPDRAAGAGRPRDEPPLLDVAHAVIMPRTLSFPVG
jgi:hypothetical protein